MRILQINSVYEVGSTGKIMKDLADVIRNNGYESFVAYGCGKTNDINSYCMESRFYQKVNILKTRLWGRHGFYNKSATKKLIKWIDYVNPDIIHLHNLHGHYLNIQLLFEYIARVNKPVVWTLHDCWAFTGHCAYFDFVGCDKWKEGCCKCPQKKSYPVSWFFDRSEQLWHDKKNLFNSIENMTIVTPSEWLSDLVKKSFLSDYPVYVINNGIDLSVFKPTESSFRDKYNLNGKKIILGVASVWSERKGLKYFIQLSKKLDDRFKIVLIGIDNPKILPKNIIALSATNNTQELAEIYSTANIFVNPTLEDNFPTVNIEALACGTPVITFNTGGSVECIDNQCGIVVEKGNINKLEEAIYMILNNSTSNACIERAQNLYDKKKMFSKYINIYEKKACL